MTTSAVTRGPSFLATFKCAAALDTTTSLDYPVCMASDNTVKIYGLSLGTDIPIGMVDEVNGTAMVVNLFSPTRKGTAGGVVAAGARLVAQSGTGKLITAAGTITALPIIGVAVADASFTGVKLEFMPVYYGEVPIVT